MAMENVYFTTQMPVGPECTRKPRERQKPYNLKQKARPQKNAPRTAAKPTKTSKRETLTGADWKAVFAYVDEHPSASQNDIVRHFSSKKEGALVFNQSTLSRKLNSRLELEDRFASYPNALSSKRMRVVTRPDVERALILWVRHMEERGETVTGPMLKEKRRKFEEQLDVPEQEHLQGDGWVAPFCRAFGIKERRRHGEAGSVDLEAVEAERKCVGLIMAAYAPKDRWNIDETSLFPLYVSSCFHAHLHY